MNGTFRSLPSVDQVLGDSRVKELVANYSRIVVLDLVRNQLAKEREFISNGGQAIDFDSLVSAIKDMAQNKWGQWPSEVINGTGVILHTNLGRAPLSHNSVKSIERSALTYTDLELSLSTGKRDSRQTHVTELICQLTGAEKALVVNNNASAVLLALSAIAHGKEVIISRGEAVEIGGGFRIPDVLRQSGADLIEVGTTNRTYINDYRNAVTERTAAILSVHSSNFKVVGFTHLPKLRDLVELGNSVGIPVIHDLGSGCLIDTLQFGLSHEPMPQESIRAGVDMGFFSGDKLLGGPQSGIIIGKTRYVSDIARHPLARAIRIDKLNLAALNETLLHYIRGEALDKVPVWSMIAASRDILKARVQKWKNGLGNLTSIEESVSTIGGGSLPDQTLPSWVLAIDSKGFAGRGNELARRLRLLRPAIIGRIENEKILIDSRTVLPGQDVQLVDGVMKVLN